MHLGLVGEEVALEENEHEPDIANKVDDAHDLHDDVQDLTDVLYEDLESNKNKVLIYLLPLSLIIHILVLLPLNKYVDCGPKEPGLKHELQVLNPVHFYVPEHSEALIN